MHIIESRMLQIGFLFSPSVVPMLVTCAALLLYFCFPVLAIRFSLHLYNRIILYSIRVARTHKLAHPLLCIANAAKYDCEK